MNSGFAMMLKGTPEQLDAKKKFTERTAGMIKDSKLLDGLIPKWSVGCRYVSISSRQSPRSLLYILLNKTGNSPQVILTYRPFSNRTWT